MPDLPAVYLFTDGGSAHSRKRRLRSFIFCSAFQLRQLSYLVPRLDGVRYTISPGEWGCRFFFRKNRLPSLGSEYLDAALPTDQLPGLRKSVILQFLCRKTGRS